MAGVPARSFRFPDTFVHLGDDARAVPLPVGESFWSDLAQGRLDHLGPGRLVSCMAFDTSWDSWERHPAGEELVCLLEGALDLVVETPDGPSTVELRGPGAFTLVPRGAWHTATLREPCRALFVTPGAGTEHRPRTQRSA